MKTVVVLALAGAALVVPALVKADDLAQRRKQLADAIAEEWDFEMRTNPETATMFGEFRYNDRLGDRSMTALHADNEQSLQFLRRVEAIDTTGFPEQEQLNKLLLVRNLRESVDAFDLKIFAMPIDQMAGVHLQLPQLVQLMPFKTVKDYQNYLARLHQMPQVLDQNIELARLGIADGLVFPKFLAEKVAAQAKAIGAGGDQNPFLMPLAKFPDEISVTEQKRLGDAITKAVEGEVLPAYLKFARFVEDEYVPKGRLKEGIWSVPGGEKLYRFLVKQMTTSDLSPEEIHEVGLKQVASIEAEMTVIAKKLGYSDWKALAAANQKNKKLFATSREQILDEYRKYTDQMYGKLPALFGRMPKGRMTVQPVESFREAEAAGAEYLPGTPDGSRRGQVVVNTGDFEHRKLDAIEATAYHEGVPGHHMQVAIAQELPTLPPFRQHALYMAYVEGWALYTERLGKEVGLYQDLNSEYGMLQNDMLRAIRLVVDTGVHYKRWTRQQMVDFFHAHSAEDEPNVQAETDRYIAWPGQALAYKIGQLKIIELRDRAKKELSPKFDIRAFHDAVLESGALPLDVLEGRMNKWIRTRMSD